MEDVILKGGWVIALLYFVIREGMPLIGKWLPLHSQEKVLEIEGERLDIERREQRRDREVAALENISKTLAVQHEQLAGLDRNQDTMLAALALANTSLTVVLDRVERVERKQSNGDTGPNKPVSK